jgi:hypothetical protein
VRQFKYNQAGLRQKLVSGSGSQDMTFYAYDPALRLQSLTHWFVDTLGYYPATSDFAYNAAS